MTRRPFCKGPRHQPRTWEPKSRRQRRWCARRDLEKRAASVGLLPMFGEASRALRARVLDVLEPWRKTFRERTANTFDLAAVKIRISGIDYGTRQPTHGFIIMGAIE